jgi:RNA polymerase sigma factor (sigma-70 family)
MTNAELCLRLVHFEALRLFPRNRSDYDELCSVGLVGAARALLRYQPGRIKFGTYAGHRIRGEMLNDLRRRKPPTVSLEGVEPAAPTAQVDGDWWDRITEGLSGRQKLLLKLRFQAGFTQAETARVLGVHWSRVSQMEAETLRFLRGKFQRRTDVAESVFGPTP